MDYMLDPPYTAADAEAEAFEHWLCNLDLEEESVMAEIIDVFWDVYSGSTKSASDAATRLIDRLWKQQLERWEEDSVDYDHAA